MQNFVFENPTRVIFGKGSIARIGQELKRFGSKALMVYGSGRGSFTVEKFGLDRLRTLKRPEIHARAKHFHKMTQFAL